MNIIPESVSFRPSMPRPLATEGCSLATEGCSSSRPFVQAANVLLLPAPPMRLALPAPRPVPLLSAPPCAGLLSDGLPPQSRSQHNTAYSQNRDYVFREKRSSFDDLIAQIDQMGPFQTIEEADAEIAAIHEFFEARRRRIMDDYQARRRARGL